MLTSKRLLFRPWQDADAEALFPLASDPAVGPACGWSAHTSVEESREVIRTVLSDEETYAVLCRQTGELVGSVGIFPTGASCRAEGDLEIGYWIGRKFWGQGFCPEAVELLLSRCFTVLHAETVWCAHYLGNDKSMRVQEKCGFRFHHMEYIPNRLASGSDQMCFYNRLTKQEYAAPRTDSGASPRRVLVTGFAPFAGEMANPSYQAAKALSARVCGIEIFARELPVVFGMAGRALMAAIRETKPDLVVCAGQAGGTDAITLERVAVNLRDAAICDNDGNLPLDEPVVPGASAAYFTGLPVRKIADALRAQAIPTRLSLSAGTYVCNDLFYTLLHELQTSFPHIAGGFVHVPFLPAQAAAKSVPPASMALSTITRALYTVIAESL